MSEGEITRVVVEGGWLWVREGMTEEVREGAASLLWFIDLWAGVCAPNGVTNLFQYAIHVYCLPT